MVLCCMPVLFSTVWSQELSCKVIIKDSAVL